ncbi:hypothetical protein C8F04DRAFT_1088768 [Mycena alexandri]|uniref:Golgi apparatus membrane protein TVP38 n=1 Tax=Mycena alexandri TaxID=1745969 RepID=A0AAD6T356_9AGAR|nr:hypothetical protein C8F04DRAFT_1088768 [Mycena alexandri]
MSTNQAPYPVYAPNPSKSSFSSESSLNIMTKGPMLEEARNIARTPSPTRSEFNALHGIKEEKTTKQKIKYYGIAAVLLVVVILFSVFQTKIIHALKPFTDWLAGHKLGPLVLIAILIVLSFPPLFGHEIIAILAGVAWDFPLACAIVATGTILGEIANYFTFKYACSVRSAKMEAKDLSYGLLAHVVREGGFLVVLVIRYSAIPPHFATAIFSTVGINFLVFLGAAVLSLPKVFVPVYVGYALKPENANNTTASKIDKGVVALGIFVTIVSYKWIANQMKAATPDYSYLRRKARQGKMAASSNQPYFGMSTIV